MLCLQRGLRPGAAAPVRRVEQAQGRPEQRRKDDGAEAEQHGDQKADQTRAQGRGRDRTVLPEPGQITAAGAGEQLAEALRLYTIWAAYDVETEGVFVAHASIHGNTARAAERLVEILKQKGCPKVAVSDLCRDDLGEAIEDAFRYGRMICLASSYDAGVFPPMYDFLHHLEIKAYQRRRVGLVENGSWAPSAAKTMRPLLEGMKQVEIVEPVVTLRGRLKEADIPQLEALADAILA